MPSPSKLQATHKAVMLSVWLPLTIMTLAGQCSRVSTLSLDLSIGQLLLWPLPSLCALTGASLLFMSTLELTRHRHTLHTLLFTCYALLSILLICIEGAAMNFAHVTGSLLDAQMLKYALSNTRGAWDLISASTPMALKVVLALVAIAGLSLPHILRRTLSPLSYTLPTPLKVLAAGCLLLCLPFGLATWIGEDQRHADATLPGTYAVITSMFTEDITGTASALTYSTKNAIIAPTNKPARNVVLILLESTRASSTTPYNPELNTTPYLNELADKSLIAMHAYSVVPHTSKAVVSTGCGVAPYLGVDIIEASKAGIPQRCMAKLFDGAGYATAFFQSATQRFENRGNLVKNMGFKDFYPLERLDPKGFKKANYFGLEDDVMLKPSMAWVARQKKPFFLTYLTVTPHHEYLAPKTYGRHDFDKNKKFNRYLNSVRYVDHFVKNVIDGLKAQGIYEDTIIAVVGDHGEAFGEHKLSQHDKVMYEEGAAIPLIIHDPSRPNLARRITSPVSQLDLMPTLIELSNHKLLNGNVPGLSLTKEIPKDRAIKMFCWTRNTCAAMIKGRTKLIHNFGRRTDEFYDLDLDAKEARNRPERVVQEDVNALLDWQASVNKNYASHHERYNQEFVTTSRQSPTTPLDVTFDDDITIYGYDLTTHDNNGVQYITLNTYFEVTQDVAPGWKMFVHGVDAKGKMKNLDHIPLEGMLPIDEFKEGTFVKDSLTFPIPKKAASGSYDIYIGFWHKDKKRMKAIKDGQPVKDNSLLLTTFTVN